MKDPKAIELFAGAGGLAIGTARAGFRHALVAEWNHDACETIRENQKKGVEVVQGWKVVEGDVRKIDYRKFQEKVALVAGGPPCQPFSLGGKHRGHEDERDMFPEAVRAVREAMPKAFLVENVKGLLRRSFATYFNYILLQLEHPEIARKGSEEWPEHLARLERHHTSNACRSGLNYQVVFRLLNAANYGVPQRRERVIIVGFRDDQNPGWAFPEETHSEDRLLWDQWVSGEYWDRHKISKRGRPEMPEGVLSRIERLKAEGAPSTKPWQTVRDALLGLPDPTKKSASSKIPNHRFVPGARSYPGHTGSHWDAPAKTLKAGAHGVPGGENMLLDDDGSVRYFTVRESARLQTFPNDYVFQGAWGEIMRQLGNAVPVELALTVASSVKKHLIA